MIIVRKQLYDLKTERFWFGHTVKLLEQGVATCLHRPDGPFVFLSLVEEDDFYSFVCLDCKGRVYAGLMLPSEATRDTFFQPHQSCE